MRGAGGAVVTMAVVLLACRAVDPGPRGAGRVAVAPEEPTREVESEVAQDDPAAQGEGVPIHESADAGEVEASGVAAAPEPVPPQAVVPIALPFPPRAFVIRPVLDHTPVVLFPDEASAVRRRVAKALVARGYDVVPVAELERIEAAAAEGRLVLEGDQVCRTPLLPEEVTARYFAERPFVGIEAACFSEPCQLQVTLQDPGRPDFYRAYASRVARVHDPAAWIAAVSRLRTASSLWGGIIGGIIGSSHPPPVQFDFAQGVGPWGKSPIDEVSFAEAQQRAAACAHPDVELGFRTDIRASVDERGRLSRCTATSEHTMARPADGVCLCEALELLQLPPGAIGRRFRVMATDEGGFRSSSLALELVQPGTETWLRRIDESPALARCMAAAPATGLAATLTLALDPDGGVTDVRIDGDITTPPTIALARCLVKELRLVALPCRPPGVDRLQLRLVAKP